MAFSIRLFEWVLASTFYSFNDSLFCHNGGLALLKLLLFILSLRILQLVYFIPKHFFIPIEFNKSISTFREIGICCIFHLACNFAC
jgi:hypothetical protein